MAKGRKIQLKFNVSALTVMIDSSVFIIFF
jgi:hypothetical protein